MAGPQIILIKKSWVIGINIFEKHPKYRATRRIKNYGSNKPEFALRKQGI